jgi:hypothetical protein
MCVGQSSFEEHLSRGRNLKPPGDGCSCENGGLAWMRDDQNRLLCRCGIVFRYSFIGKVVRDYADTSQMVRIISEPNVRRIRRLRPNLSTGRRITISPCRTSRSDGDKQNWFLK